MKSSFKIYFFHHLNVAFENYKQMLVAQKANFDNSFSEVAWKGNMKPMNELWRHKKNVMATKVLKKKGFPKYTKTL
jgi:hypothetical protein